MAILLQEVIKLYKFMEEDLADPRTKDMFLVSTLWRVPLLVIFYLYFTNVLGPKFMKNRQPYKLDRIIQIYNVLQILVNLYLVYASITMVWLGKGYSWTCEPVDYSYAPESIMIAEEVWFYFMVKLSDLLDTIFFILKKKESHVSFLHAYHHSGMAIVSWLGIKYLAGGQSIFLGTINAFVHSIMYTYYLLSSLKINMRWWKKYITQLQMIQFFILVGFYSQLLWTDCGYPQWIALAIIPQNFFMLILFGEFYVKTYMKKKPVSAPTSTKNEKNDISTEIVLNGKLKKQ